MWPPTGDTEAGAVLIAERLLATATTRPVAPLVCRWRLLGLLVGGRPLMQSKNASYFHYHYFRLLLEACGIVAPHPGFKPGPLAVKVAS